MQNVMKILAATLAAAVGVALLGAAAPAASQAPDPRTTVGYGGSLFTFSPFVEAAGEEGDGARLDDGFGAVAYARHWLNPWVGAGLEASWGRPRLELPAGRRSLDVWTVALGLELRPFGPPRPVAPFLHAGGGVLGYRLGDDPLDLTDSALVYRPGRTEQLLLQAGGGLDLALLTTGAGRVVALRLDATHLRVRDRPFSLEDDPEPDWQAHWRFSAGLQATLPRF